MEFGQPYYLLLILILPLLVLWYFKKGQNQEATIRFSNLDLISKSVIRNGKMKNMFFIIGRLFIMLLIIFALARPRLSDTGTLDVGLLEPRPRVAQPSWGVNVEPNAVA